MRILLKEALGYSVASAGALCVDIVVLWILVHFFTVGYLLSSTISFVAGAFVAYELSIRLAFKQHRLKDRHTELVAFILIGVLGLGVNAVVIFFTVSYLGLHYLAAKCVAAGFTFSCNFIARRQMLFALPISNLQER